MSVQTTVVKLATLCEAVNGVKKAYPYIPRILTAAMLPAFVIEPGEAVIDVDSYGDEVALETRVYRLTLFLDFAAFGTETQSEMNILPYLDSVRDTLLARPGLQAGDDDTSVYDSRLLSDSGYRVITYPTGSDKAAPFAAIEYRMQVKELHSINYQD